MINAKLMEERLAERLNPEGIEGVSDMAKKMMDERPQVNLEDMANAKPPTSQQPARKRAPQPAPQQPAPQQ